MTASIVEAVVSVITGVFFKIGIYDIVEDVKDCFRLLNAFQHLNSTLTYVSFWSNLVRDLYTLA